MDILLITVVMSLLLFDITKADNNIVHFKIYHGHDLVKASRSKLFRCGLDKYENSVGVSYNPATGDCSSLSHEWSTDKDTVDGVIYMENSIVSEEYVPPKIQYRNSDTDKEEVYQKPLVELRNGSQFDIYFSSDAATTGFKLVLRKDVDYLLRASIEYDDAVMICVAKYNNIWSSYRLDVPLQFTVNKIEKLGFRAIGIGYEIYHDDQKVGTFKDTSSPHLSYDFKLITIWISQGSSFDFHHIVFTQ